jgi:Ca2+-binding RTX toxin-like protein
MARFHWGSLFNNARFEDFLATLNGGSAGHDHLNGSASANMLFGGGSADSIAGMAGNDMLNGGTGDDKIWGGSGNDQLDGGSGADMLTAGFGSDRLDGGAGNDILLSRSDAGEMVAAQDGTTKIFAAESAAFKSANDVLAGGRGGDTFRFEGVVNAKDEIVAKHVNADGTIDWAGVTGENNAVHDHWVDGFGKDTITDFNRAQGDKIQIAAHTAEVKSIDHIDTNQDGRADTSIITVISQQGASGAHDEDLLGTITVRGDLVKASDISVDAGVVYGAYDHIGQLPAGVHFQIEDDGIMPGGASDGGHHMTMA